MSSAPAIRRATAADLAALVAIDAHSPGGGWSVAAFEQELGLAWSCVDVAVLGSEVVGFVVTWSVAGELEITNLATHPARRRAGIARALVALVLERAAQTSEARARLEVRAQNAGARALYESFGFVEVGRRRDYYHAPDDDAVLMAWSGAR